MPPSKKPDIICFGDSLTVGYQSPTPDDPEYRETPYADYLQTRLPSTLRIVVSGVCGEVTAEMLQRFPRDVLDPTPSYVVILGGTNDLGCNVTLSDILNHLTGMYQQAKAHGIQPIAITIPSLRFPHDESLNWTSSAPAPDSLEWKIIRSHIERRLELNKMILGYCSSHKIPCINLFTETAEQPSQLLAAQFSNDGLHLSTRGYEVLAQLLWDQVFQERYRS